RRHLRLQRNPRHRCQRPASRLPTGPGRAGPIPHRRHCRRRAAAGPGPGFRPRRLPGGSAHPGANGQRRSPFQVPAHHL
ncbi:uncharacterized protein METZ01_LOCUS223079, partial [marine metagenome]